MDACCGRDHNAGRQENSVLGTKPTGMLVFTEDGRFIYLYTKRPAKGSPNSGATTTPQEGAEISKAPLPPMAPTPLPTRR